MNACVHKHTSKVFKPFIATFRGQYRFRGPVLEALAPQPDIIQFLFKALAEQQSV